MDSVLLPEAHRSAEAWAEVILLVDQKHCIVLESSHGLGLALWTNVHHTV